MAATEKHTIYIDIDDEITTIIDKVKTSPGKIIALVLPKRATVLQSIVNMKLLKKSSISAKKNIVLITSEAGLLPLAGAVGLHVAATLQTKPVIPLAPDHGDSETPVISEEGDEEPEIDKTQSIGALAGIEDTETIELDDQDEAVESEEDGTPKKKSKKGFKVPNFDRFRLSFILGILAIIVLVVGWVFAAIILPTATIVITTDTSSTLSNINFTANTALTDLSVDKFLVPAVQKEVKKTDTEKTTATGKQDNGTKATGTVTLTNCIKDNSTHLISAGTTFSNGNLNYITNVDVTLPISTFQGNTCKSASVGDSKDVAVAAAKGGIDYNNPTPSSYTSSINGILAYGSAMAGGTTNLVTVLSQNDVDIAAAKMKGRLDNDAKKDLASQLLTDNLKSLDETLVISAPVITVTPAVGAVPTGDVTVTSVTTYDILGVKTDYLSQLVKKDISTKIDTTKQSILDDGLGAAVIHLATRKSATEVQMSLQTLVIAGPQLNADSIKQEIKGKKRGDVQQIISSKVGVKDVTITYKPFWVLSTPKSVKKITVTIQKPVVTNPSTSNDPNP